MNGQGFLKENSVQKVLTNANLEFFSVAKIRFHLQRVAFRNSKGVLQNIFNLIFAKSFSKLFEFVKIFAGPWALKFYKRIFDSQLYALASKELENSKQESC